MYPRYVKECKQPRNPILNGSNYHLSPYRYPLWSHVFTSFLQSFSTILKMWTSTLRAISIIVVALISITNATPVNDVKSTQM